MPPDNLLLPTGDLVSAFLPEVVSEDPSFKASIQQMTQALQVFVTQLPKLLIKANFQNLTDSNLINELGVEFQPPGYDQTLPLYQRKQMIQSACYDNAHLGTPASVIQLVNLVFGNAILQEWWQYDGLPYHFRILTTDSITDPDSIAILNTAILATKPVSRWPDPVTRLGGGTGILYLGAAFFRVRTRRFPDVTI